MNEPHALVEHFFRHEFGRLVAAERGWREALRLTTARADREILLRRLLALRVEDPSP
jgi:RNA polymerase sigma-70 factor (ECF subfamily)